MSIANEQEFSIDGHQLVDTNDESSTKFVFSLFTLLCFVFFICFSTEICYVIVFFFSSFVLLNQEETKSFIHEEVSFILER